MAKKNLRSTSRGGVSKDAQSGSVVGFKVNKDNKFNIAFLKSVNVGTRTIDKDKSTEKVVPVITFHFIDGPKEERQHFYTVWFVNGVWETNNKTYSVQDQNDDQDNRFAHFWDQYMGTGHCAGVDLGGGVTDDYFQAIVDAGDWEEGIEHEGTEADYFLFYHKVAHQFNTGNTGVDGKPGKPIYRKYLDDKGNPFKNDKGEILKEGVSIPVWIKLTYYKGNLDIPRWGNVMDRYVKGRETLLQMSGKDKFEPAPSAPAHQSAASHVNNDVAEDDIPAGF